MPKKPKVLDVREMEVKKMYAVIHVGTGKIEYDAYFNGSECCCSGEPEAVAIYDKKYTAEQCVYYNSAYKVVPVTILVPKAKKK